MRSIARKWIDGNAGAFSQVENHALSTMTQGDGIPPVQRHTLH